MQNKGAIKALTIIFGLIFLYQLSFTVVTKVVERKADKYAKQLVYPTNENGEEAPVADSIQEFFNKIMQEKDLANMNQVKAIAKDSLEKLYLLDKENNTVYNLLVKKYTYSEARERQINLGLDLRGGMSVTLEVSIKDLVVALAHENANDPTFQQAIEQAELQQKKNGGGDFVNLFGDAYKEIDPQAKLASIFADEFSNKGINNNSENSEVLKALKEECEGAIDRTYQILRTRIDRFGVAQPNIQKLAGRGQILVELPGVKEPDRVRKLLKGAAQLEFWETYTYNDMYQDLLAADKLSAELKKGDVSEETTPVPVEKEESVKEQIDENQDVENQSPEVDETGENENTENIEEPEEIEDIDDIDTTAQKELDKNPLFSLLRQDSIYPNSACMGRALKKDTAQIREYLVSAQELNRFQHSDVKFAWTAKPEKIFDGEYFDLVALKYSRDGKCALGGEVVTDARQDYDQNNQVEVTLQMNRDGARDWKNLTGDNIGKQIAIVLDNLVYSYPSVRNEIPNGRSSITGNFTVEEAQDLANILKAGKLPVGLTILSEEVVGPSLGKESIQKGMWSMIFAFILVLIYMIFFYKKAGMVANIALIVNVFFLFGVLACLGSVLTLPGIAGIVLTLGMAVDSNVIIFERIKEELRGGKGLRPAIDAGYKNAYSAIIDGNVTTLITGIVLIVLGTGPVHSFAVTLCIGILTSLFTSIFITRLIFTRMLEKDKNITFTTKLTENFLKNTNFDFIKFRKTAYIIACVVIVISAIGYRTLIKKDNFGIDFKGGRNYIVSFDQDVKVSEIRDALDFSKVNKEGWEKPEVKTYGSNGQQVKITTKYKIDDDSPEVDTEIQSILYNGLKHMFKEEITEEKFAYHEDPEHKKEIGVVNTQKVGATIANDIRRKSIWAIAVSLVLMFAYIALRFRKWQYGLSAVAALAHDTIIMIGIYSLLYNVLPFTMEIDQAFIAAVLTIIGYSINATVVVFDRVRENTKLHPKATWKDNINSAINSTLTRSFNTSGSTFVVLLAIFFFGGDSIRGFIFALLVGILAGTFSSVFLSSPIAYNLLKGHKQEQELNEAEEKKTKK